MADEPVQATDIKETDIVFDCPYCAKSLAIDYKGAGLFVTCPDCRNRVQVPIPEGMEVEDMDRTDEDKTVQIIHLREALAQTQRHVDELESQIGDLRQRRETLEQFRSENLRRFDELKREVDNIERALEKISDLLRSASDSFREVR